MKKLLKKLRRSRNKLKNHKYLSWIINNLQDKKIWRFNRMTVSKAFAVGLFCAFMPIPFQMILATFGAIIFSANLPLSVFLVWISNPITIPFIFYFCYKLGAWILGVSVELDKSMSLEYVIEIFFIIWKPFLLGCFIVAIVSSILGYVFSQLFYTIRIYRKTNRS